MSTAVPSYGTQIQLTWTSLNSLASSSTMLAGAQCTVINNTSYNATDWWISGRFKWTSAPGTNATFAIWGFGQMDETSPTYPDVLGATDAAVTFTSVTKRANAMNGAINVNIDTAITTPYYIKGFWLSTVFGGTVPKRWGLWAAHNGTAALSATGSDIAIFAMPYNLTF